MFNINGEIWRVLEVPSNHPGLRRSDGSFTVGVCDDAIKTIFLNENLENGLLKKVLCHEITHAAMFSYNIEMDLMQEEMVADLLATYGQEIISITNKIYNRIK